MHTVHVRVWEYEVRPDEVDAFLAAYGAKGAWAQLFARAEGYVGTQLYRDVDRACRFLTVDMWADGASWEAFLAHWRAEYDELDRRLHGLASGGVLVAEGVCSWLKV